jgi:ribosomal protein S27AE
MTERQMLKETLAIVQDTIKILKDDEVKLLSALIICPNCKKPFDRMFADEPLCGNCGYNE